MEQMEPKENQLPETEEETRADIPEPRGTLLGEEGGPPLDEPPCPCPCPCDEE
jgi:hypothetical protein